ncbi:MAG: hypothetical protein LH647_18660 [Leptolyngbyaceae cyanobacterium CAN_BIN12]|nr:hypothetical protein [Leptolyngbyaceae cyanobacterium CAN_BIN12]
MTPSSDHPDSHLYGMALRPSQVPSSTPRVAVIGLVTWAQPWRNGWLRKILPMWCCWMWWKVALKE